MGRGLRSGAGRKPRGGRVAHPARVAVAAVTKTTVSGLRAAPAAEARLDPATAGAAPPSAAVPTTVAATVTAGLAAVLQLGAELRLGAELPARLAGEPARARARAPDERATGRDRAQVLGPDGYRPAHRCGSRHWSRR